MESEWPYQLCQCQFLSLFCITNMYYVQCGDIWGMIQGISFSWFLAMFFDSIIKSKCLPKKIIEVKLFLTSKIFRENSMLQMFALWNPISFWGYLCSILLVLTGTLTSRSVRVSKPASYRRHEVTWENGFISSKMWELFT